MDILMRCALVFFSMATTLAMGADDAALTLERRLKAAFLYKFAAYVQWPERAFPDAESPIVIGVLGADKVAEELEQLIPGRRVGERPIKVHWLKPSEATPACCQILFIGRFAERGKASELLAATQGMPVLTVTEVDGASPQGSVINFFTEERIRFDISRDAAERNGLHVGSQLLAVARRVGSKAP